MQNVRFILALETANQNLNTQAKLPNHKNYNNIFDNYRELFWVVETNKQTTIFVHPDVIQIFGSSAPRLQDVIKDWQRRTLNADNHHYITALEPQKYGLGQLCSPIGHTSLHDISQESRRGEFFLKITNYRSNWQFIINLNDQFWYVHSEMLKNKETLQGWTPENYTSERELKYSHADEELSLRDSFLEELIPIEIHKLEKRETKLNLLHYHYWSLNQPRTIEISEEITKVIEHVLEITSKLIDNQNVEQSLENLGYRRPQQKIIDCQKSNAPDNKELVIQQDEFRIIQLGDIEVRQRIKDEFICANDMCRPFPHADLWDWLKLDRTWNDFASIARQLGIEFNSDLNRSSTTTRVVEAFPALIERKKGNSYNGGGTWLEHHAALKLSYWVDVDFATKITFYLEEYAALKTILRLKHQDDYAKIESEIENFLDRKLIE